MRRIVFATASLALIALVPAGTRAAGVSLRWDNCYSDGGVINRTFACDTNAGSERLVMSFMLDSPMSDVAGQEMRIIIMSVSATVPLWWQMKNVGSCRQASLGLNSVVPPGSTNCVDWAHGTSVGGIGSYVIGGTPGFNSATLLVAVAVPPSEVATLGPGQEYSIANVTINHAKTVGTGACAGCDQPVCLVLDYVNVTTPVPENHVTLRDGAFGADSNFARWQDGQESGVTLTFPGPNFGLYHSYTCQLSATPTRNSTWGAVKSLYR
jgi:hypothetical protein